MVEKKGAGEFIVNNIGRDGMENGYDLERGEMPCCMQLALTVLGGAGNLDDIKELIDQFPIIGAAGSLFIFKGKYRAVLINYPDQRGRKK